MSDRAEEAGELRRLSAALVEVRAELMVTQAALAAAMAEIARLGPEPEPALADAVSRLLGFADAAAAGLKGQPLVRADAPTTSAIRMADWAEGLLAGKPRPGAGLFGA